MQPRGAPIQWYYNGFNAGGSNNIDQINLLDVNCTLLTLKPHERVIIDSFQIQVLLAEGFKPADVWLSDINDGNAFNPRVVLTTNPVAWFDPNDNSSFFGGGGGSWCAPPTSEGISFPVGLVPYIVWQTIFPARFNVTGTGYVVEAGGYTNRPPYYSKIS